MLNVIPNPCSPLLFRSALPASNPFLTVLLLPTPSASTRCPSRAFVVETSECARPIFSPPRSNRNRCCRNFKLRGDFLGSLIFAVPSRAWLNWCCFEPIRSLSNNSDPKESTPVLARFLLMSRIRTRRKALRRASPLTRAVLLVERSLSFAVLFACVSKTLGDKNHLLPELDSTQFPH